MAQDFASRLRTLLAFRGLRQKDLAAEIRAEPNTVNGWINGRKAPIGPVRYAIACALNVPFEWLETGQGPSPLELNTAAVRPAGLGVGGTTQQIDSEFGLQLTVAHSRYQALQSRPVSMEEIAARLNEVEEGTWTGSDVEEWMRGVLPPIRTLLHLVQILDVPIKRLFSGSHPAKKRAPAAKADASDHGKSERRA